MSEEGEITPTQHSSSQRLSKVQQLTQRYYHSCRDNAQLLRALEHEREALHVAETSCYQLQQEIATLHDLRMDLKLEINELHTRISDIRARNELLELRMREHENKEDTRTVEQLQEEVKRLVKSREKLHESGQEIIDEKNRRILQLKGDVERERKEVKMLTSRLESSTLATSNNSLEYLKLVLKGKNQEIATLKESLKELSKSLQ